MHARAPSADEPISGSCGSSAPLFNGLASYSVAASQFKDCILRRTDPPKDAADLAFQGHSESSLCRIAWLHQQVFPIATPVCSNGARTELLISFRYWPYYCPPQVKFELNSYIQYSPEAARTEELPQRSVLCLLSHFNSKFCQFLKKFLSSRTELPWMLFLMKKKITSLNC